jgi:hypothetical protein
LAKTRVQHRTQDISTNSLSKRTPVSSLSKQISAIITQGFIPVYAVLRKLTISF